MYTQSLTVMRQNSANLAKRWPKLGQDAHNVLETFKNSTTLPPHPQPRTVFLPWKDAMQYDAEALSGQLRNHGGPLRRRWLEPPSGNRTAVCTHLYSSDVDRLI